MTKRFVARRGIPFAGAIEIKRAESVRCIIASCVAIKRVTSGSCIVVPSDIVIKRPKAAGGIRVDAGWVLQVPANVHAFLERQLPEKATGVSARIWQDGKESTTG